jgi:hypothetical protein
MSVALYDPQDVAILFGGVPLTGWAEGEFLAVEYAEEAFTIVVGADGLVTRSKNANTVVRATVKLMQSSRSNDYLSAIHNADKAISGGAGVLPFAFKDNSGTSLFAVPKAWIVGFPAQAFDKSAKSRDWIFECPDPAMFIGGNG